MVFVIAFTFFACETIQQAASIGLQAVGVSPQVADALARSGIDVLTVAANNQFEEVTPEQEYFLGRAVAANILASYRLKTDAPALTTYVNRIAAALVVNSIRPEIFSGYHVAVLDSDEINAFATPGGHIFLTLGLVNSATSEDTLASVIAHEIAHVQLAHGYATIKNSRLNQAFAQAAFDVGSAGTGYDLAGMAETFGLSVDAMVNVLLNGYSREQEFQADAMAMSLMSLAGYEPSALIDMLRVLETNQSGRRGGFNNTHPTPAQRIANAQTTVGNYNAEDTRSYREARYRAVRQTY